MPVATSRISITEAFGEFRRGILKHIGMEEKILLPAIQRLRCGEPLAIAAKLRLDHGAIAALLRADATRRGPANAQDGAGHANRIEEGPDGVYAECDRIADIESEALDRTPPRRVGSAGRRTR